MQNANLVQQTILFKGGVCLSTSPLPGRTTLNKHHMVILGAYYFFYDISKSNDCMVSVGTAGHLGKVPVNAKKIPSITPNHNC